MQYRQLFESLCSFYCMYHVNEWMWIEFLTCNQSLTFAERKTGAQTRYRQTKRAHSYLQRRLNFVQCQVNELFIYGMVYTLSTYCMYLIRYADKRFQNFVSAIVSDVSASISHGRAAMYPWACQLRVHHRWHRVPVEARNPHSAQTWTQHVLTQLRTGLCRYRSVH